jgi:hypothetical protein
MQLYQNLDGELFGFLARPSATVGFACGGHLAVVL